MLHKTAYLLFYLSAQEIATLRKEAQAFKSVRTALRTQSDANNDAAKMVFQKVCISYACEL